MTKHAKTPTTSMDEIPTIRARAIIRTSVLENAQPNPPKNLFHRMELNLQLEASPFTQAHGFDRVRVSQDIIKMAFKSPVGVYSMDGKTNYGHTCTKTLVMVHANGSVRISVEFWGAYRKENLPRFMAIHDTTIAELWCYLGVSEKAWPLAKEVYGAVRDAHNSGNPAVSEIVVRALDARVWQLKQLAMCKNPELRVKLRELIDATDAFIESVLYSENVDEAIALATDLIEGTATLNDDFAKKLEDTKARAEAEEQLNTFTSPQIGDVIGDSLRHELAKKVRHDKRSRPTVAKVAVQSVSDDVESDEGETDPNANGTESDTHDAGTVEGTPATATTPDRSHLTPRQRKIFADDDARKAEAKADQPEPVAPRDIQAEMAAQLAALKSATPATDTE